MAFKGITFAGQNVTPKNDGGLYQAHYGDGILWGCSMNISGDDLVIQSGEFIMGGRVVQVDGATNVDLSGRTLQTGYIQVIMNADLSQGEGSQWYTSFVEQSTIVFPALTQGNINNTDTLYQIELAVVQVSGGNLNAVYRTMDYSPLTAVDDLMIDDGTNQLEGFVDANGSGLRGLQGYGSPQGLFFPKTGSADVVIYGNGDSVFIRPYGVSNDTGRATFYANGDFRILGQMLGGTTTLTGPALVSSVTGNTVVARVNSGLDANARYIVFGYFGGTPSNANSGSTDMAIDVDGTAYRITSIYSNSAVAKYQTMCAWVIGATSKIELRVWTSSQYSWNNIVANLQVVQIA